jgi:predicted GH43/DUF377 family glycosyl hydrolase
MAILSLAGCGSAEEPALPKKNIRSEASEIKQQNLKAYTGGDHSAFIRGKQRRPKLIAEAATVENCVADGYAQIGFDFIDFTIFKKDNLYHTFYIAGPPKIKPLWPGQGVWFGHAVSENLDTWTTLDPAICAEPNNYFESGHLWSPFILEKDDTYYMFYTGVTSEPTQVLCLATSNDPELKEWKRHADNPIIPLSGLDWHWKIHTNHVSDARDPHVVQVDDHYLLAYTAVHESGCSAVGGMISDDLLNWEDIGPILYRPLSDKVLWQPESCNIQQMPDGKWALFPSATPGIEYYLSDDPHDFNSSEASKIRYLDGGSDIGGIEVISRKDRLKKWLVAFFETRQYRLFLGEFDFAEHPWTVRRIHDVTELGDWNL